MSKVDISIIIPTYNERDNINVLLDRISKLMKDSYSAYEVVIVDDNSPDGTSEVVRNYKKTKLNGNLNLIVRKGQKGLGSAVVEGFNNANGDILVVMDADLQHPPEKIIELVDAIKNENDIAIGSRYVSENGFGNFSLHRKIISKCASILGKAVLTELRNVKDIQSGFFAIKRDVIKNVKLNPIGYKILVEILVVGNYKNVKEISYEFGKRERGETKLGTNIVGDYIMHLSNLFWRKHRLDRFARFCIAGGMGTIVNIGILFILTSIFDIYYMLSAVVSYEASILNNFIINDIWTFKNHNRSEDIIKDHSKQDTLMTRLLNFHWTRIVGTFIGILLLYILTEFMSINYLISNFISIMIVTIWSYFSSVAIVWRNR